MVRQRQGYLKAHYNLSAEDFEAMASVNEGRCWICDGIDERVRDDGTEYPLSVDHDHETGAVRGLLCNRCNTGLGLFSDDPEMLARALEYLKLFNLSAPEPSQVEIPVVLQPLRMTEAELRWPSMDELEAAPPIDKPK